MRQDIVEAVADLYCDETKRKPVVARQIKERIKHHALLTTTAGQRAGLSFDHEDFKSFFTGVSLGRLCVLGGREDLRSFLRIAGISEATAEEASLIFDRSGKQKYELISILLSLIPGELSTSFVLENVGRLIIRAIDSFCHRENIAVEGVSFSTNAFAGRKFSGIDFVGCYFAPTSIDHSKFENTTFRNCRFERIEAHRETSFPVTMIDCDVSCIVKPDEEGIFDPAEINKFLKAINANLNERPTNVGISSAPDEELATTERAMRIFIRSTQVNEETFKVRLGNFSALFFDAVVPELLKVGVLEKVPYRGSGRQDRFRLGVPLTSVQDALALSSGSFKKFINQFPDK